MRMLTKSTERQGRVPPFPTPDCLKYVHGQGKKEDYAEDDSRCKVWDVAVGRRFCSGVIGYTSFASLGVCQGGGQSCCTFEKKHVEEERRNDIVRDWYHVMVIWKNSQLSRKMGRQHCEDLAYIHSNFTPKAEQCCECIYMGRKESCKPTYVWTLKEDQKRLHRLPNYGSTSGSTVAKTQ